MVWGGCQGELPASVVLDELAVEGDVPDHDVDEGVEEEIGHESILPWAPGTVKVKKSKICWVDALTAG